MVRLSSVPADDGVKAMGAAEIKCGDLRSQTVEECRGRRDELLDNVLAANSPEMIVPVSRMTVAPIDLLRARLDRNGMRPISRVALMSPLTSPPTSHCPDVASAPSARQLPVERRPSITCGSPSTTVVRAASVRPGGWWRGSRPAPGIPAVDPSAGFGTRVLTSTNPTAPTNDTDPAVAERGRSDDRCPDDGAAQQRERLRQQPANGVLRYRQIDATDRPSSRRPNPARRSTRRRRQHTGAF